MRRKPIFESLESRLLLSADLAPVEGVLEVFGTNESDLAFIRTRAEHVEVVLNDETFQFALEDIKEIRVDLGEGDNRFEADLLNPVGVLSVVAGGGSDVLRVNAQWDGSRASHPDFLWLPTFNAGAGDDFIEAVMQAPGPPDLPAVQDVALAIDLGTGADTLHVDWRAPLFDRASETRLDLRVDAGGADAALPEVGDEVLVTFMNGDPDRPFVLGTLWNSQDAPEDDKHLDMTLVSAGGGLALSAELLGGAARDEARLSVDGLVGPKTQVDATVHLGGGADAMTIDFTGLESRGSQKLAPVSLDLRGGEGRDTLAVIGTDGRDRVALAAGGMTLAGAAYISFAGFESVRFDAWSGNDAVTMAGPAPRIDWLVDGGEGRDRFAAPLDFAPFIVNFEKVQVRKIR